MRKYLLLTATTLFTFNLSSSLAQEDDESCVEPDKKVMKLLKTAESLKNDKMERIKAYTDAVKLAPDNAYVYYSYATFNFRKAEEVQYQFDEGRANMKQLTNAYTAAANAYKKSIQYCPEFHSDS